MTSALSGVNKTNTFLLHWREELLGRDHRCLQTTWLIDFLWYRCACFYKLSLGWLTIWRSKSILCNPPQTSGSGALCVHVLLLNPFHPIFVIFLPITFSGFYHPTSSLLTHLENHTCSSVAPSMRVEIPASLPAALHLTGYLLETILLR